MRISKYVRVDKDVLVEWIYDNDNNIAEDYRIVIDTLSKTRSFSQTAKTGNQKNTTNNTTDQQLFLLNRETNKWGVVDANPETNRYLFLQYQTFPGNVPSRYDTVRVHLPVNYSFKDKIGFLLNIGMHNKSQDKTFNLSNYFFDKTDYSRNGEMMLTSPPFMFQEKLWGKYIDIHVPSPYTLAKDYVVTSNKTLKPRDGSLHMNLVENDHDILSTETPVVINFAFLNKKEERMKQRYYLTSEPFNTTLPTTPEYENLTVKVEPSQQGDYFEIYGVFNNTISEFNQFMRTSSLEGRKYYIIYTIRTFEKNLKTGEKHDMVYDNFDRPIEHRPIIKYSNTTATIEVTMKLVNTIDDSVIERTTSYSMLQDEVAKYSRWLTKINVKDTFKPKVYNSKPDQINLVSTLNSSVKTVKVQVPYAVMHERYNVVTKNKSETVNSTEWYGLGLNLIMLYPSDNIVKFAVGVEKGANGIVPFNVPKNTNVVLTFKSPNKNIEVPLYHDSNEVDLSAGMLVFRIPEAQYENLRLLRNDGFDQFYIILKTEHGVSSVLYPGRYRLYN